MSQRPSCSQINQCQVSKANRVCCWCADTRLFAKSYSKYIDGIGFSTTNSRCEYYCYECKRLAEPCSGSPVGNQDIYQSYSDDPGQFWLTIFDKEAELYSKMTIKELVKLVVGRGIYGHHRWIDRKLRNTRCLSIMLIEHDHKECLFLFRDNC